MAVSNSRSLKHKTPTRDQFDCQNGGEKIIEFQTLVENIPVIVLIFQDWKICYANPATKLLTGYNKDELLINTNLLSQLQLKEKRQISERSYDTAQDRLVKLLTKNGEECWLNCSLGVVQFANKPAISITAVNITKHQKAEQKIEKILKQEKRLVSMVSHELRNPLNIISFSSNLLKTYSDRQKPEKVKKCLERLQRGVDTLSLLIDEWLILGKVDSGKLKFEPQRLNIGEFCRNLLFDLELRDEPTEEECDRHNRQINLLTDEEDAWASIDRRILQLILTNLLENAIKYSPRGQKIDFIVACSPEEVTFKIKDRGIGISPGDRQKLFEPFYRGNNVDAIPGHGLGLAIVNKLIDIHHGQITVHSEVGIGTEFVISLPQSQTK